MRTLLIAVTLTLLAGCGDDGTVTSYSLDKMEPNKYGHKWMPLNPTTYTIRANSVVGETAGFVRVYKKCAVATPDNWDWGRI